MYDDVVDDDGDDVERRWKMQNGRWKVENGK